MPDPYDPPVNNAVYSPAAAGGTAVPESSGVARTMGILGIVFGSLMALYDLVQLVSGSGTFKPWGASGLDPNLKPLMEQQQQLTRELAPYTMTISGLMFLMSVALILIGVGLYKHRELARRGAMIWSVMAFVVLGLRAWLFSTKIWPKLGPFMDAIFSQVMAQAKTQGNAPQLDPSMMSSVMGRTALAVEYGSLGVLAIFPALLLILVSLSSVKERMR
jgi:hypothetical protein